jgi:hypothetical protein
MNKSIKQKKTKMNKSIKLLSTGLILGLAFLQSCKKDPKPNVPPINEGELITTLILNAKDSATGQVESFKFRDQDGEGGNAPTQFDSIILKSGHSYAFEVLMLDESKAETDTISIEVLKEGEDHLLVYTITNLNLNIMPSDSDNNGLAIGLKSIWKAIASGNGKVKTTLKHQPGIKNGDPALGETDIEIEFNCRIQ